MATATPLADGWQSLGTPARELRLEHTLTTGQSFRWLESKTQPGDFSGVIGSRVVEMRQLDDDVHYKIIARGPDASSADDLDVIADYFNLSTCLADLSTQWCEADPRFKALSVVLPGARMLRQDPLECLFSFICSSNNHISRIHGMVTKLTRYGTRLPLINSTGKSKEEYYAFPTLKQLEAATEEDLRDAGFGYRARYIVGAVQVLAEKPGGGDAWLKSLRNVEYSQAIESLCELPGVGPKVAACVALFSLDKHGAIPVDTHVWQLATKYYATHLRGKTLSPKLHDAVQAAFVERFGAYAGWAHNTLFIAELAHIKQRLAQLNGGAFSESDEESIEGSDDEDSASSVSSDDSGIEEYTPSAAKKTKSRAAAASSLKKNIVKETVSKKVLPSVDAAAPETPALDVAVKKTRKRTRAS